MARKILIVGGGVAGPAFAGLVQKYDLGEATLIERAPKFGNIGYVIALWGNGRRILRELDLDRHVGDKEGYEISWNAWEDVHAKLLKVFPLSQFRRFGSTIILARAALQRGLVNNLHNTAIRFGTTVTGIVQQPDKKVQVTFNDNTQELFDLVVGADGVRSSIRDQVFGTSFLKEYGWGIWVYWLPESFKHASQITAEGGEGKLYSVFPLYDHCVAWFVAKVPPGSGRVVETRGELLKKLFADFQGRAPEILSLMPADPKEIFYDDLAHVDMPMWYKGRVALMGDAKHAASPISGMGASMALEDAYVLADELRKNSDIDTGLEKYSSRRKKRIKKYNAVTERLDRWTMVDGFASTMRDALIPLVPTWYLMGKIKDLVETDI